MSDNLIERDAYGWPVDPDALIRECYEMSLPSFERAWGNPEDAIYDDSREEIATEQEQEAP